MYHLIKLARLLTDDKNHQNRLIAGNDKRMTESIDKHTLHQLTIYGLIEIIPSLLGLVLSLYNADFLFKFDFLVIGLIITIVLIYIFKTKIPEIPIGYKMNKQNHWR